MRSLGQTLRRLRSVCPFVVFLVIALPPTLGLNMAAAEILLQDDFENAATSNTIWTFKNPSVFGVVLGNPKAHSGNGVLELRYDPGTTGPGFETSTFSGPVPEVYVRWYEKYSSNWKWSGNGQKVIFIQRDGGVAYHPKTQWGGNTPKIDVSGGRSYDQNVGTPFAYPVDAWVCMEMYVRQDAGGGTGQLKLWVNDTLKLDHTGVVADPPGGSLDTVMISAYYNQGGDTPNGVPELQFRWIDDVVASTARIGCLPDAGDKTPPSVPKGLNLIVNP